VEQSCKCSSSFKY